MRTDPNLPPVGPRTVDGWFVTDSEFPSDPIERLVYYARLAPSIRNSQPWKFLLGGSTIDVFSDCARWLNVADGDRREMHLSLGCAIESLRIAADFGGYGTGLQYFPMHNDETLVARVSVALGGPKRADPAAGLLRSMLTRRTSRSVFDPAQLVSEKDRSALYSCFEVGDVSLHFLSERVALDVLVALKTRADAMLFAKPEYRAELAHWVGRGALGNSWLMSKIGQLAVGHLRGSDRIARDDTDRVASAPLMCLLTTRHDRRVDQIQAGEAYMRIALVAESRDLRIQPVSQVLETAETRAGAAKIFGLGERTAQHLFRLGHAEPEAGSSTRLPLESIVVRLA
jgi:hypothetical protein